ncbi:MAG: 30S ribosomal protein S2 [Candidatus Woesebacteria bacterium]
MAEPTFSVDLEALLEAGCHFGHQARRWNPKMGQFIYTERDGVHIFDLAKTATQLEAACVELYEAGKLGKNVVFVGTKRQAQEIVREHAIDAGAMFIVTRWPAGLITNWEQVGKSISKLNQMKKDREEGKFSKYTKFEQVKFDKQINKLERFFGGVSTLKRIPDMLVIADINTDLVAIKEANIKEVPVLAIADSNTDPDLVKIAVPGNDDAVGSIKILISTLAAAYKQGKSLSRSQEEKAPEAKPEAKKE